MINNFKFSQRSVNNLSGIHRDLVRIVKRALEITSIDFSVTYGMRTVAQQAEILKKKKSTTKNSRHLTGHAVDLTPWLDGKSVDGSKPENWSHFATVARAMKMASLELKIPMEWGGDWETFKDGYHFQLPWASYPLK
jgi:peptidoglycan L-alanyl-D-glutamate endopeptidase CwlK